MSATESRVPSPRELLTEDELARSRAFGVPALLLFAARGAPKNGHFHAIIRDRRDPFRFSRCTICPDHVWVVFAGASEVGNVPSGSMFEVRIADVQGVSAVNVFDVTRDGIREDSGVRMRSTPTENEITTEQLMELMANNGIIPPSSGY